MENVKWRINLYNADAKTVYDEIKTIADGKATKDVAPKEIVQYARENPDSELHKCFEWDDTKAAEKWRTQQARSIVVNLIVDIQDSKTDKPVTARVILQSAETNNYKPAIFMNTDEYARTLKRAWDELREWKNRYKSLKDAGIQAVIEMID